MSQLKLYLIILPAFLLLDFVWLGVVMKGFYATELQELLRRSGDSIVPRWGVSVAVYLLIPAGIVLFVRPRLSLDASLGQAFCWGAMFGFVLYGVYDLTNLSILDKWTLRVTLADMAWGSVLCGTMSVVLRLALRIAG